MSQRSLSHAVLTYLEGVEELFSSGVAREHAYRPLQITLLDSLEDTMTVNDAAKSVAGFPDFTLLRRSHKEVSLGYGEGKDLTASLDKVEKSEQLKKYLIEYNNFFLTNVLEFRFYRGGKAVGSPIVLGKVDSQNNRIILYRERAGELADRLESFVSAPPEKISSASRLATIMAGKARLIRDHTMRLMQDETSDAEDLHRILAIIRDILSPDMTKTSFADMYAQTMVYGLFAARFHDPTPDDFDRHEARELIGKETEFLRAFFDHITGVAFPRDLLIPVNELCEVFAVSDVKTIVQSYLSRTGEVEGKDPIIHFYELFLKEYSPEQRKLRGVYYTPTPVVRYMVRTVDELLKKNLVVPSGLASSEKIDMTFSLGEGSRYKSKAKIPTVTRSVPKVQILDPAVGTATFLNEIIRHIHKQFEGQEGVWPTYAREELVPRLYGLELMVAPYSIAHLKLAMTFSELGVSEPGQMRVYLNNSLEEPSELNVDLLTYAGLAGAFSREATHASEVKTEKPLMVVIGNPPWAGHSENKFPYADSLVKRYKVEPGGYSELMETNPKWLNDDYVKFFSLAEQLVAKNNEGGILAMITSNAYISNPTFRGMRWRLAQTFDDIYIVNLRGSLKTQDARTFAGDENVFDITQGVAIFFGVKYPEKDSAKKTEIARVQYASLQGSRVSKFTALENHSIHFQQIELDKKFYFFEPRSIEGIEEYRSGLPIDAFFEKYQTGMFTGRDHTAISFTKEESVDQVTKYRHSDFSELRVEGLVGPKETEEKVRAAQRDINADFSYENFVPISYRPFDLRWTYYTGRSNGFHQRPRGQFLTDLRDDVSNYALIVGRQGAATGGGEWTLAFVARYLVDLNIFYRGGGTVFPLRIRDKSGRWHSNISKRASKTLARALSFVPSDGDIVDYIYGVLNSPSYRDTASEFLKSDYPVIPVPAEDKSFERHRDFGSKLRHLHLLESPDIESPDSWITSYPIAGDNIVTRRHHEGRRLWINPSQYIDNVPASLWDYRVGGYQVLDKWLMDRMDKTLTNEELMHLQKMITAIAKAMDLKEEFSMCEL